MKIKLQRRGIQQVTSDCQRNWTLEVEAVALDDTTDAAIFVYQDIPDDDPIMSNRFTNVASLYDMNSIPLNAPTENPDTGNNVPFYRLSTVTLDFVRPEEAERAWRIIKLDTENLVKDWNAARNLELEEEVSFE